MAITPTEFKARFPEFDSIDDSRIQVFIDDAVCELDESAWGCLYDKGLAYLSAHLLYLAEKASSGNSAPSNALASHAVDGVSESFTTPSDLTVDNSSYQSTEYGKEYARLLGILGVGNICIV